MSPRYTGRQSRQVALRRRAKQAGFALHLAQCRAMQECDLCCDGYHAAISGNGIRRNRLTMTQLNALLDEWKPPEVEP